MENYITKADGMRNIERVERKRENFFFYLIIVPCTTIIPKKKTKQKTKLIIINEWNWIENTWLLYLVIINPIITVLLLLLLF